MQNGGFLTLYFIFMFLETNFSVALSWILLVLMYYLNKVGNFIFLM
jgi:hypothetical protein